MLGKVIIRYWRALAVHVMFTRAIREMAFGAPFSAVCLADAFTAHAYHAMLPRYAAKDYFQDACRCLISPLQCRPSLVLR